VNVPAGFQKWRLHWFECPACGHGSFRSHAKVIASAESGRLPLRFWCERCGGYSTLKWPLFHAILGLLVLVLLLITFVVFYNILTGSLLGLPFFWALMSCVALAAASPLLGCALTRLTNRYVQISRAEP